MREFADLANVEIVYVVDPDQEVLDRTLSNLQENPNVKNRVRGIPDVRTALDDQEIDAISVATPNHWHSLMTIWAAQAGKHCYVEKPASHDIREGRVAVQAWKKYGTVIQHGTQRRSNPEIAGLHDAIRAGKFGKLLISYGYCCKPRKGIGFEKISNPPANLDWDLWRGPAEIESYHANYVHYDWHWFWKTGNGDMNNQGTHQLDVALWALDPELDHPKRVMALGGRFSWNDQGETPNTMFAIAEYANGQSVFFNVRNVNYEGYERQVENEYYFEDGGKIVRGKYYPAGSKEGEELKIEPGAVTPGGAFGSFVTACREGRPEMSNADMAVAHQSCVLGHLMNDSYRLGKKVPFNARAGRFGDNTAAHDHFMELHAIMRDGCGVPEDKAHYIVGPWLEFDGDSEVFQGEFASQANKLLKDENRKGFQIPDLQRV
jgi:predicted dehydrogenase